MADRRGFLAILLGLGASGSLPLADAYVPTGYLHARDVGGMVDHVTLDGRRITGVFETDDVEGWLRRRDKEGYRRTGVLRTEYLTGAVRVHWKPDFRGGYRHWEPGQTEPEHG